MEWRNDILSFSGFGYGVAKERVTGPCECHLEVRESSEPLEDGDGEDNRSINGDDDENEVLGIEGYEKKKKNQDLLDFYLHSLSDTIVDSADKEKTAVNITVVENVDGRSFVEIDLENSTNLTENDVESKEEKEDDELKNIPISQMIESCESRSSVQQSSSVNDFSNYLQDQSLPDDWKKFGSSVDNQKPELDESEATRTDSVDDEIEEVLRSHQIDSMTERRIENEYFRDIEQAERKLSQALMLKSKWAKMRLEGNVVSRSCLKPKVYKNPWRTFENIDESVGDKSRKNDVSTSWNCVIC